MGVKLIVYDKNNKIDSETNLDINSKKNILDQALDNNSGILFGCFGGSCGTCKCKILEGKDLINKSGTRAPVYGDLAEDDFLPCIATLNDEVKKGKIIIKKYL